MELPFAVESPERTSPERTSQILQGEAPANNNNNNNNNLGEADDDDDGSSLVTTSSQGSFLGSSSEVDGFGTVYLGSTIAPNMNVQDTTSPPVPQSTPHQSVPIHPQQQVHHQPPGNYVARPQHAPPQHQQHQQQQVYHQQPPPQQIQQHPPQQQINNAPLPPRQPQPPQQPPVVLPPAPPTPPTTQMSGGITSGLNIFGNLRVPSYLQSSKKAKIPPPQQSAPVVETVDFTYVNVCETDADEVDISLDARHTAMEGLQGTLGGGEEKTEHPRGDILAFLLSGAVQTEQSEDNEALVFQCEEAHQSASHALQAKKEGNLQGALEAHASAAKAFRECAVLIKDRNANMANSLLLLSQTQAKSALALKRIVKQQPSATSDDHSSNASDRRSKIVTQKDRLRAAVRGALATRTELDISDSAFLGKATKGPMTSSSASPSTTTAIQSVQGIEPSGYGNYSNPKANSGANTPTPHQSSSGASSQNSSQHNPVDDMMELERELRDMDMALELGNSMASLDARTQSRLKNSIVDGSFMVVPGSESYMSSSNMWSPAPSSSSNRAPSNNASRNNTSNIVKKNQAAQARAAVVAANNASAQNARKNRVQNILQASSARHPVTGPGAQGPQHVAQRHQIVPQQQQQPIPPKNNTASAIPSSPGLESSWWGSSSTASQVLASSVISLGASSMVMGGMDGGQSVTGGVVDGDGTGKQQSAANTKQLMQLMDALKRLGDENAELLRQVEGAEAARMEAKAAKEQMAKFKAEYGKRFASLKAALEKFRKQNAPSDGNEPNPVTQSNYMQSASTSEQLQRQEQLIRKLTSDLKKEKEASKKRETNYVKLENFYREVKARSAKKQKQKEAAGGGQRPPQQQQQQVHHGVPRKPVQR